MLKTPSIVWMWTLLALLAVWSVVNAVGALVADEGLRQRIRVLEQQHQETPPRSGR